MDNINKNIEEMQETAMKHLKEVEKKEKRVIQNKQNKKQSRNMRKVKIDGVEYMRNTVTGKLYSMPRTVTTRKIMRNRLRTLLKQNGFSKVNKIMSNYWKRADVQEELRNNNF